MDDTVIIVLFAVILPVIFVIYAIHKRAAKENLIREQVTGLANNTTEMTVEEFFEMRSHSFGGRGNPQYSKNYNFEGVFILFNKTKNMYYIGQGQKALDGANNHLTGKGNGDVYADLKHGDEFTVKMISLETSGYSSLNELKRHTIFTYDAYAKGYNKTRGNS